MLCDKCGKRPATFHFKQIINGKQTDLHLCEQCAEEDNNFLNAYQGFDLQNLLAGLINFDGESTINDLQCKTCGLTFSQFSKIGKFGCPDCYTYFRPKLDSVIRRIQGNNKHRGKIPKRIGAAIHVKRELDELKQLLQQKIAKEEFEEAAKIRDQIRELEQSIQKGGNKE